MRFTLLLAAAAILSSPLVATSEAQEMPRSESAEGAQAYIISPQDGERVSGTVKVKFGLTGMGVAPAGVDVKHTGHHHLLINKDELPKLGMPMGSDVIHFGGGQTETTINLEPGEHTLQLILGDKNHIPHEPVVMSKKITIFVEED